MPSLIGTGPNQIPTNNLLGSLAFQDAENVKVENANAVNISTTDLTSSGSAILTNISYSGTMTGGAGVINIGPGQLYKDASGNVGVGMIPTERFSVRSGLSATTAGSNTVARFQTNGSGYDAHIALGDNINAAVRLGYLLGDFYLWVNGASRLVVNTNGDLLNLGTGATKVQEGTTAQRPSTPQEGMIRKNSTLGVIEGYSGGGYVSLEAGRLISRTVYSTPGSYTWTPSAKTKHAILILISGGGGSGGCPPTTASQASISVPGSPGQFVRCEIPRGVSLGGSYSVTVGAAGAGGTGSASPTNGVNGGVTIVQNNTDSSFISITGGWYGAAGYATTVFPETVSNVGPNSINNSGGHFVVLERNHTIFVQGVLFGTNGNNWTDNPSIAPCVAANPKSGVAGLSRILAASSAAANGNSGGNGEVIIYEYS